MKPFKDRIVNDTDGLARYNLVGRDGQTVTADVLVQIASPLHQEGDKWGAREINLLFDRDDDGNISVKFLPKENAATKVDMQVVSEATKTAQLTAEIADMKANSAVKDTMALTALAVDALYKTGGKILYLDSEGRVSAANNTIVLDTATLNSRYGGRLVSHGADLLLHAATGLIWSMGHLYPLNTGGGFNLGVDNCRWGNVFMVNNPNVSCDSKGKVLIANVNFSGTKPKGRSAIASIPIEDLRSIIRELAIREYHRYKSVIDEEAPPQIITSVNENGEETAEEIPVYKQVIDTEHKELGIFIDDLKDNKYFDLFGRVSTDEETGEKSYSMDTGSYATLALAGAKDALNRLDALEVKANKYDGLCDLLVSKGILTKEEIQSL